MNSAYNQISLDEQSRQLATFVIGNQQYEFIRLFYGISIRPAAFSAFMSKMFRPLILKKLRNHILRCCFHAVTNERRIVYNFRSISSNTQKLNHESSPRQITFFPNTRKFSWPHYRKKHYNSIEITDKCNSKTSTTHK